MGRLTVVRATSAEIELERARAEIDRIVAGHESRAAHLWHFREQWPVRIVELVAPFGAEPPSIVLTPAIAVLREWHDMNYSLDVVGRDVAVLSGPVGTGKTVAAAWLAVHRWAIREPLFVKASDLVRRLRDDKARLELREASAIVIDDIGAEHADSRSGWLADFDEFVDALYGSEQGVVFTTNLTAKQFKQRYGARVMDRLAQCSTWIPVVGESMRTGGAK